MIQSPPRRIYRLTVVLRLALGILFLLAAGVFIGAGLSSDPIEYAGVAVGVVILAAYGGLWVAMGKTTVTVFSEGVRRTSVFGCGSCCGATSPSTGIRSSPSRRAA